MSRKMLGLAVPLIATGVVLAVVWSVSMSAPISKGITAGTVLALLQSIISVAALNWAWNKKFVYWVWGGGMFFRMAVFAGTAILVYRSTEFGFVSTMVSMVTATTAFLVVESMLFFGKR